jgi:glycogen debranching enzyme
MLPSRRFNLIRLHPQNDTQYVAQGRTVFATGLDGFITGGPRHGLFVHETRMISLYRYLVNGQPPLPVTLSNAEQHSWLGYYALPTPGLEFSDPDTGSGLVDPSAEDTLELRLSRYAGQGLHEDVDLTNFSLHQSSFLFELEVDADFADQIETRSYRQQQGELKREWRQTTPGVWELAFSYHAEHTYHHPVETGTAAIDRQLTLQVENSSSPPVYSDGRLGFQVDLDPGCRWHACINLIPRTEAEEMHPIYSCRSFVGTDHEYDRRRDDFLSEATGFSTCESGRLAHVVVAGLEQAKRDLAGLRLYDLDYNERAWTVAAGFPYYIALFGRDTLTAAWQAALASTELMVGTLYELPRWQGTETNDWRDEQPGRMLHEAHTGPLEFLNINPRRRYYGSITTSGFYPVVVSELWHWTGDRELVRPLLNPMFKALRWLDEYSDLDGDGFYEYQTRSPQGSKHQAWKDSRDGIVYEDGTPVEPPIATCEEQGFIYLAKLHASEMLWWLGEKDEASRLHRQAGELKKRFNDAFWMDEEQFFAMGLDAQKRPIRSIGSNPGHLLATGIADEDWVRPTAERLFAPELFSGWGIRTLSTANPAYNPYSYHRGSVWPVEQATFAIGFLRYGLHDLVEKICLAQFEAATLFDFYRLPEVFSGHARDDEHPFPALYPQTNWPQAWSSSAILTLVQSLLGLYPYAPLDILLLDPHLPEWLPDLTLHHLRVGKASITIHFYRKEDGSSDYEIMDQKGKLHVFRQPSPWSLTASFGERLVAALRSLLPGK